MANYIKYSTGVLNPIGTGIILHVLTTPASKITLKAINSKVPDQSK